MVALRKTKGNMENDEAVAARLLVLATAPERRSKSGCFRTLLPAIETSLQAGVSLEVILAKLNKQGLEMNIGTFKSTLYLIRSKGKTRPPRRKNRLKRTRQLPERIRYNKMQGQAKLRPLLIERNSVNSSVLNGTSKRIKTKVVAFRE